MPEDAISFFPPLQKPPGISLRPDLAFSPTNPVAPFSLEQLLVFAPDPQHRDHTATVQFPADVQTALRFVVAETKRRVSLLRASVECFSRGLSALTALDAYTDHAELLAAIHAAKDVEGLPRAWEYRPFGTWSKRFQMRYVRPDLGDLLEEVAENLGLSQAVVGGLALMSGLVAAPIGPQLTRKLRKEQEHWHKELVMRVEEMRGEN